VVHIRLDRRVLFAAAVGLWGIGGCNAVPMVDGGTPDASASDTAIPSDTSDASAIADGGLPDAPPAPSCSVENGGCDPLTTCSIAGGSVTCGACPSGYDGDGVAGCVDIDECIAGTDGCDPLVTCTNMPGGYTCGDCPMGTMGGGATGCIPIPLPPTADDQALFTDEDVAVSITLTGADPEGAMLLFNVLTSPSSGALSGIAPDLTYTPDVDFDGVDSFTFEVSDGALTSGVATVTITVNNVVVCGDGVQEGAETCDDANLDEADACLSTCALAACGDGFVQAGIERCDDGNLEDTDACPSTCALATCGDGFVQAGVEGCDDGNTADDDGCGHSCRLEGCGDGLVQLGLGETCDDGGTSAGDGCDAACHVEPFVTTTPVRISGTLSCTTSVANAARKIAVDGSGTLFAVMQCGTEAYVAVSRNRGVSFSAPFLLSAAAETVSQVAIGAGPSGVGYAAIMLNTGAVYLRTTVDYGMTWSAPSAVGTAASTSSGLSLQSFNDDVYVGFSTSGGVAVARNATRGLGTFEVTNVSMSIAFFDLLYDVALGTLVVAADTPSFHVRASTDGGVTFASEVSPPGSEFYSDWALGNGTIFAVGTNLGSSGNATLIYTIPTSALTTSSSVSGLPGVSSAQTRTVTADTAGNAYVASQLNSGAIQLDRLPFGAATFDAPRTIAASGGSPIVAPLPGARGAAVVYTVGTEVFATIQAY
jgi:cysteine-rich repeat protein